jgi:hypothetical protein
MSEKMKGKEWWEYDIDDFLIYVLNYTFIPKKRIEAIYDPYKYYLPVKTRILGIRETCRHCGFTIGENESFWRYGQYEYHKYCWEIRDIPRAESNILISSEILNLNDFSHNYNNMEEKLTFFNEFTGFNRQEYSFNSKY